MEKREAEIVNIFYKKSMRDLFSESTVVNSDDYVKVCEYPVFRAPGHSDLKICNALFELFNWIYDGFQPDNKEIKFNRNGADHTSMSVGDIVEMNGNKYICTSFGWKVVL